MAHSDQRADDILYKVEDGIAIITINRPDRMNSITYAMTRDLVAAFDRSDADDDVRAVIVTGAGERAFSAGADVSGGAQSFDYDERSDHAGRPVERGIYRDSGGLVALRIFDSLKPVIGAINGVAAGFGATIILSMDVRIAAEHARFGYVFARRGIVPESAATWFLPRIVGVSRALDWCYSGRLVEADEALQSGLLRSVEPKERLLDAAKEIARSYMEMSAPVSVALTRQMIWKLLGADHPMAAHQLESLGVTARGRSADAKEGVAAFLEKRKPDFPDRVSKDMPDFFPWWDEPKF